MPRRVAAGVLVTLRPAFRPAQFPTPPHALGRKHGSGVYDAKPEPLIIIYAPLPFKTQATNLALHGR